MTKLIGAGTLMRFFCSVGLALILVGALNLPALSQATFTFTEWNTPTPSSEPLHVISASPTQFYFTEGSKSRIGGLNILNNSISEWRLRPEDMPHGLVLDANAEIAFCSVGGNYLAVFNPTNSLLTAYPVPTAKGGSIHLDTTVSASGSPIYFLSEHLGNKIAMVDPSSPMQFTEWTIPSAASNPWGVAIGQADGPGWQVYFAEVATHKIGMLDTFTNQITEWSLPKVREAEHIHFVPNHSGIGGIVYFGDFAASYVGALDPRASVETLWTAATSNVGVPDVFVEHGTNGQIYLTELNTSKIGFLDTALVKGARYSAAKTTTIVSPALSPVTPLSYDLTKRKTTMTVTPGLTNVQGFTSGGLTEWTTPTEDSGPLGITGVGRTTIIFTEYYAARIGMMVPSP